MLSNTDPEGKTAIKHIKFSALLGTFIPASMSYIGIINPVFLPFYYGYFYKSWTAIQEFEKVPSEQNAKKIKVQSYSPFFILLSGIYITLLAKKAHSCVMKS